MEQPQQPQQPHPQSKGMIALLSAERDNAQKRAAELEKQVRQLVAENESLRADLAAAKGETKSLKGRYHYKLSAKDDDTILAGLARHSPLWAIAERIGCCRQALAKYIHETPVLQQAYTESQDAIDDLAESKLFEKIQQGNMDAIAFYMPRKMRHRGYGDHQVVENKGDEQRVIIGHIDIPPQALVGAEQTASLPPPVELALPPPMPEPEAPAVAPAESPAETPVDAFGGAGAEPPSLADAEAVWDASGAFSDGPAPDLW